LYKGHIKRQVTAFCGGKQPYNCKGGGCNKKKNSHGEWGNPIFEEGCGDPRGTKKRLVREKLEVGEK